MPSLDQLRQTRIDKLEQLRELSIDPYPATISKNATISDARAKDGSEFSLAGRVLGKRGHGKIVFFDLQDESGSIQIVAKQDVVSGSAFRLVELIDIGDFVSVTGTIGKTQAGELSIFAKDLQMAAKAIRPLPDSWYGLKDVEERYRKRYLDMILNSDVTQRLKHRAGVISAMRSFLDKKGFIEVETPTLQPIYGGGFAKPFVTHHNVLDAKFYLRISDELYLKRLIVGGLEKVYEITKVFRNEGIDHDHNPEFTMFEAQIAYEDYTYGMDIFEEIIEFAAKETFGTTEFEYHEASISVKRPWKRYSMTEAIKSFSGIDPLAWGSLTEAKAAVQTMEISEEKFKELDRMMTIGEVIAFAFEEVVEEKLIQPTIIYDYPIEVSPLAKKCEDPRFTQRFEVFAFGSEIGNNYSELNDPIDLHTRFVEEKKREEAGFDEAHQTDYDYLTAIEHGFPPTCGLGIGIDRVVMMLTNARNIKEVIAFPTLRPEKRDSEAQIISKPDTFFISKAVGEQYPTISVGIARVDGVSVRKLDEALEQEKAAVLEEMSDMTTEDISTFPHVKQYRKLYKTMGIDWHSRRPSPEALLRRVAQGKGLYTINTCVDATNVVVMKYKVSAGVFDADLVQFPTKLDIAPKGDTIELLGDDTPTVFNGKELAYIDKEGAFNIDFNYRDAKRTIVTEKTKNVWINVDGIYDIHVQQVQQALDEILDRITKYCGGTVVFSGIVLPE